MNRDREPVLSVQNLNVKYGSRQVINDFTCTIQENSIVALIDRLNEFSLRRSKQRSYS